MLYIIALAIDALMALINYYALQKVWSNIEINGKCAHSLTDRLTLTWWRGVLPAKRAHCASWLPVSLYLRVCDQRHHHHHQRHNRALAGQWSVLVQQCLHCQFIHSQQLIHCLTDLLYSSSRQWSHCFTLSPKAAVSLNPNVCSLSLSFFENVISPAALFLCSFLSRPAIISPINSSRLILIQRQAYAIIN